MNFQFTSFLKSKHTKTTLTKLFENYLRLCLVRLEMKGIYVKYKMILCRHCAVMELCLHSYVCVDFRFIFMYFSFF